MGCATYIALSLLLALEGGASHELGTALRQEGYSVRPPHGFRMVRMDLFHGTRAGAIGAAPPGARWLSAALTDGSTEEAAAMMIAMVEGGFQPSPAARDEFSGAVVRHFSEELDLRFALERAELVRGGAPRVEVLGTVRMENQLRFVLVSAMQGEGRHAVIIFSFPSGRWDQEAAGVRASLESFRVEASGNLDKFRPLLALLTAGAAAALLVSILMWRRRLAFRP